MFLLAKEIRLLSPNQIRLPRKLQQVLHGAVSIDTVVIFYQTALKYLGISPLKANLVHNLGGLFYAAKYYQRARVCFKRALLYRANLHAAQDSLDTANSFVRMHAGVSWAILLYCNAVFSINAF